MTRFLILPLLLLAATPSWAQPVAPADTARYVPGTEDVPLMPGLAAEDDSGGD